MRQPRFYAPDRVGERYRPDVQSALQAGRDLGLPSAADDDPRIVLLLVDAQIDFVHPEGSLAVPGAVEDARRTAEWIFEHVAELSAIKASLDSHVPMQIFYPTWWVNDEGEHPDPNTPISERDVEDGTWRPVHEPEWSVAYVHRLQEEARKDLMIWPYHTMIGSPGHTMMPALYEALMYQTAARTSQPTFLQKGTIAKTEYYSLLEPEVKVPEDPRGRFNQGFMDELLEFDLIYIAGQAKSHCVLETVSSIMRRYGDEREVVGKLRLLEDCTSSVAHPEIDFEAMANETFDGFEQHGLKRVTSEDPIG